jgi:hypothetical protein
MDAAKRWVDGALDGRGDALHRTAASPAYSAQSFFEALIPAKSRYRHRHLRRKRAKASLRGGGAKRRAL